MKSIEEWCIEIGEWRITKGFKTGVDNTPEKLMLIVTEVSEAMEAHRKNDWPNFKEELADIIIRVMDLTNALGINLELEMEKKMKINYDRPYKHDRLY